MKKVCMFILLAVFSIGAFAQQKKKTGDNKLFEEAMARDEEPLTKAFVLPQIADLQMLTTEREVFGPYKFKLNKSGMLAEGELSNAKGRALYRATMEADADLMIGTLYDSYIVEGDDGYVVVELSAYPAKFINFRQMPFDADMVHLINICYPTLATRANQ